MLKAGKKRFKGSFEVAVIRLRAYPPSQNSRRDGWLQDDGDDDGFATYRSQWQDLLTLSNNRDFRWRGLRLYFSAGMQIPSQESAAWKNGTNLPALWVKLKRYESFKKSKIGLNEDWDVVYLPRIWTADVAVQWLTAQSDQIRLENVNVRLRAEERSLRHPRGTLNTQVGTECPDAVAGNRPRVEVLVV